MIFSTSGRNDSQSMPRSVIFSNAAFTASSDDMDLGGVFAINAVKGSGEFDNDGDEEGQGAESCEGLGDVHDGLRVVLRLV